MNQHDGCLTQALGTGGADVILIQVVQHRPPHIAADLCGGLQCQHHHRHDHLHELDFETLPVGHDMGRVIDRRQPPQRDRENHDQQRPGEEGRDRKADHGDKGARLIEQRIVAVGRIDANRDRDQDAHDIAKPNHPKRLRHPLDHDIHDRAAGLPADRTLYGTHSTCIGVNEGRQAGVGQPAQQEAVAGGPVDEDLRFNPEELDQPFIVLHIDRLPEAKRLAHFLFYLWWDCQRHLGHRIAGGQLQQQEDYQADKQKRWYRQK